MSILAKLVANQRVDDGMFEDNITYGDLRKARRINILAWKPHLHLREQRVKIGCTQSEFAAAMGISLRHYQNIEAGTTDFTVGSLRNLVAKYDIDLNLLLTGNSILGLNLAKNSCADELFHAEKCIVDCIEEHSTEFAEHREPDSVSESMRIRNQVIRNWNTEVLPTKYRRDLAIKLVRTFKNLDDRIFYTDLPYHPSQYKKYIKVYLDQMYEDWAYKKSHDYEV